MKLNPYNIFIDTNVLIGAFQYVISKKMKCAYFVTNNRKDYTSFNLNVIVPQQIRSINQ
ncbi:hypothetical protein FACS1894177_07310 [Bacteroidia bacterium]|nr:hypothetical protein FACS1894177_07310 [Bacteroidia bacterium]